MSPVKGIRPVCRNCGGDLTPTIVKPSHLKMECICGTSYEYDFVGFGRVDVTEIPSHDVEVKRRMRLEMAEV
jgi:hypothetical protein